VSEVDDTQVLRMPMDGMPVVVAADEELVAVGRRVAAGTGPIAIDAERASGHRYGQRAFLVQLRRDGAGTVLVDPVGITDMSPLAQALSEGEWILHSATQDLPCLAELGLRPAAIFDTELAARLIGLPRVGLASLTEDLLGVGLAKGHGAADWSRRPLPDAWLIYAALDVELLAELREDLTERLRRTGRTEWARQEFEWLLAWQPRPRVDPWRRTSGISKVTSPRSLAVVEQLWMARERLAESLDRPPGRVMRDESIIAAAQASPGSQSALAALPEFRGQGRNIHRWWRAVQTAAAVPEAELPPRSVQDGPPPARSWERRRPEAAARLKAVRAALAERAKALEIAPEVLISPDPIRVLLWESPDDQVPDAAAVAAALRDAGCRQWQIDETAELIAGALAEATPPPVPLPLAE
jgi:ribonuclease D